jgi:hypothetical protein
VLIGSGLAMQQLLYAGVGKDTLVNGIGVPDEVFLYMGPTLFRGLPWELEDAARVDGCGSKNSNVQAEPRKNF